MAPTGCILLADDDRVDAKAFVRAVGRLASAAPVTVVRDGAEAWELLSPAGGMHPAMIVLDINMPRMNGLELLRRIRDDARFARTPVFVMTTSDDEGDRLDALELNVAGYIVKSRLDDGLGRALDLAFPVLA